MMSISTGPQATGRVEKASYMEREETQVASLLFHFEAVDINMSEIQKSS